VHELVPEPGFVGRDVAGLVEFFADGSSGFVIAVLQVVDLAFDVIDCLRLLAEVFGVLGLGIRQVVEFLPGGLLQLVRFVLEVLEFAGPPVQRARCLVEGVVALLDQRRDVGRYVLGEGNRGLALPGPALDAL
jgi:hypothetical protein